MEFEWIEGQPMSDLEIRRERWIKESRALGDELIALGRFDQWLKWGEFYTLNPTDEQQHMASLAWYLTQESFGKVYFHVRKVRKDGDAKARYMDVYYICMRHNSWFRRTFHKLGKYGENDY